MPLAFAATVVTATQEEWGWLTAFAASRDIEQQPYIVLQRARVVTEQDRRLSQDQPHIEFCAPALSWYGHITKAKLHRDRLVIEFDQTAKDRMQSDGRVEVRFTINQQELSQLAENLRHTFNGFPYFSTNGV